MDVAKNSEIDPDNRLLWRARRRRLDAEQLRDSLLLLSGELDRSVGGRHPFPHELTYFYRQHEPFQEKYPSKRRSVYLLQRRLEKDPFLDLFDGPDGNLHLADRRESTTALQALYLLNSEFVHERSKAFAERVLKIPVFEERVQFAYGSTFGRYPDPSEIDKARRFLGAEVFNSTKNSEQAERLAWSSYLRSMVSSNEFLFID